MIGMLQMISGVCKTWGNALESNFEISGHQYNNGYYLAEGVYP
jgi:hypothetical protein